MSKKLLSGLAALVTAFAGMGIVRADTGATATFTSSITYTNVGSGTASVLINFYPQASGTPIAAPSTSLAAGASTSLFLGSTALTAGFNGSAIISSDQPIAATAVQIAQGGVAPLVKNRPLSNGFASGASQVLIASTLKNTFNVTTRFNVQNASSANVDLTVKFYNAATGGTLAATESFNNLPPGAAKTFDMSSIAALPDGFNGSAVATALQSGTSTPANIVAAALELSTNGVGASSFEGVSGGANTVYMATALCNAFGGFNSFYAVQNTSNTDPATVLVTYSNGATDNAVITSGAKKSFTTCNATGQNMQGFSGAATISSTGGAIVAIGKVGGLGATTAFLGATAGSTKMACPYVRWTPAAVYNAGTRQRANIAIQNVGGALAAGAVTVKYINAAGATVATQPLGVLATGAKQSVNSSQVTGDVDFGFDAGTGSFGGGAIIEGPAGSQLQAITRIGSSDPGGLTGYAEDYNCIPF